MKRFSETTKWNDPWFRNLSPTNKLYWLWLLDNCDCAGIIEPDLGLARFMLGASEELPTPLEAFGNRVIQQGEKFLIVKFVRYQYGDSLNPANNAHKGVLKRLESSEFKDFKQSFDVKKEDGLKAPGKGLVRGLLAHQEQEQEQEQEKDTEKDTEKDQIKEKKKEAKNKATGTLEEIKSFAVEIGLPASDGEAAFYKWEGNGWKNGTSQIKDWRMTMRSWKSSCYHPSQKLSPQKIKAIDQDPWGERQHLIDTMP